MMRSALASAAALALFLSGCGDDTTEAPLATGGSTSTTQSGSALVTTQSGSATTPNIVGLASSVDDLSTLVAAVTAGELVETLSDATKTYTVFAPTNAAFAAIQSVVDDLLKPENKADLVNVLTFHVLPVQVLSTELAASQTPQTVQGQTVTVTKNDAGVKVSNGVDAAFDVTTADQMASNGVVHIINGVLVPPAVATTTEETAAATTTEETAVATTTEESSGMPNIVGLASSVDDLSTLVAAVTAGELVETLSDATKTYTVFAPTNAAFAAIQSVVTDVGDVVTMTVDDLVKPENKLSLVNVLLYHVLPMQVLSTELAASQTPQTVQGQTVTITKSDTYGVQVSDGRSTAASVTTADQMASNGVVHIVNNVLMPAPNIVGLAASQTDLSTLVAALTAAELNATLANASATFTVFAPMNEAFAAIQSTVDELLKPENKADLVNVLTYHVLVGQVLSTDLQASQEVATVQGQHLSITKTDAGVKVGNGVDAAFDVSAADQMASNGVVHIINGVLTPPTVTTTTR